MSVLLLIHKCITSMGQTGSRCVREFDTQATLAVKLGCNKPVILSFVSPYCGLCRSLERDLCEVRNVVHHCRLNVFACCYWYRIVALDFG